MHRLIIPNPRTPQNNKEYFEILTKSVFEAGFSYEVIERKWKGFRLVFRGFDPFEIAAWTEDDILNALESPEIIRNRRKIEATIYNAQQFCTLIDKYGSFRQFLESIRDKQYRERNQIISSYFKWLGTTGTFVFLFTVNEEVPEWEDR